MSLECAHESSCPALGLSSPSVRARRRCLHLASPRSYPRGNNGAEFSTFANFDDSPNGKVLLMHDKCATICENDASERGNVDSSSLYFAQLLFEDRPSTGSHC